MSGTDQSPAKENIDPFESPSRKTNINQSETQSLASPSQTTKGLSAVGNGMWDSNNPMRNPPPLPLSPQMLRNTGNKSITSSPTSPGKLHFTTTDTSEIEHQLKRIVDTQVSLKSLIGGVDTSVKQTQVDLENLVERSSNNNSHLKNLLQNVANTEASKPKKEELTQETLKQVVKSEITPLLEKLESGKALESEIKERFLKIEELLASNAGISSESLKSSEDNITKQLQITSKDTSESVIGSLKSSLSEIKDDVSSKNDLIETSLTELKTKLDEKVTDDNSKALKHEEIISKLSSIDSSRNIDNLEKLIGSLDSKNETHSKALSDLHTSLNSHGETLIGEIKKIDVSELDTKLGKLLESKTNEDLLEKLQELVKLNEQSKSSSDSIVTSVESLQTTFDKKLEVFSSDISASVLKLKEQHHKDELGKKELEIQLKDKEIAELKSKIEAQSKSEAASNDILELTASKAKLETRLEMLNEAYANRYQQFKDLSKDFDLLNEKLSQLQFNKLTNIIGNASFLSISQNESTGSTGNQPPQSPNRSHVNRVLSTNSYLSNGQTPVLSTPKKIKKYDLKPVQSDDEKESEEA